MQMEQLFEGFIVVHRFIPQDDSVVSSEYDSANDYMYVFVRLEENENGQRDGTEKVHLFWIDLKNPGNHECQYE